MHKQFGKSAEHIAELAGFEVPKGTIILAAEVKEVGEKEPLTREKLSPILAVIKSISTEDGIEKSRQMVELNGLGHSAAVHTQDEEVAEQSVKQFLLAVSYGTLQLHSVVSGISTTHLSRH